MPKKAKLTSSTDETSVGQLLSGDAVFTVPYFQRPYKWKMERLEQLEADLLSLVDGSNDTHFLGAVIIHGRPSNPSDPNVYEVIDGQQRLTTLFLYTCAAIRVLCKHNEHKDAAGLFLRYLVINRQTSLISNSKLHSSKDDRKQLNCVIQDVLSDEKLIQELGSFKYKALPAVGSDRGRLWSNYKAALRFLSGQAKLETIERVRSLYTAFLEQVSVVQIDVLDPINGPKIFDSLNSRQEPMTTGDLVRNEIFSRVADSEPAEVEALDQQYWQPFYDKFKGDKGSSFDDYFFPYGLIKNSNLKKSDVYSYLRKSWKEESEPAAIVAGLGVYQDGFLDLWNGSARLGLSQTLAAAIRRASAICPTSTYPFLMPLLKGLKDETLPEEVGKTALDVIESFLVRRALCGHEPTGLHAVFKKLWEDCAGDLSPTKISGAIEIHKTVVWPNAEEVKACVQSRPLYGSSITRFFLEEWNHSLGGDDPKITPWIEHVLPDAFSKAWEISFTEEQHKQLRNTVANLIPLSQPMNQELGVKVYSIKREKYANDSAFKAARDFAAENEQWTPGELLTRATKLSKWTVGRWKY